MLTVNSWHLLEVTVQETVDLRSVIESIKFDQGDDKTKAQSHKIRDLGRAWSEALAANAT